MTVGVGEGTIRVLGAMTKCHQCDRPALHGYATPTGGEIDLRLEHSVMYEALGERRLAEMERHQNFLLDEMDDTMGLPRTGPRFPTRPQPVVISGGVMLNKVRIEQGAIVGVVNAGSNVGSIDVAITCIEQQDRTLAAAITKLTDAIGNSTEIQPAVKAEMLEIVNAVATEATQPKEKRKRFVIGPLLTRLAELATVAEGLRRVWEVAGPTIIAAFS